MQCNTLQYCNIAYDTFQTKKRAILAPKRAILGNRCQKTARRAAERAPTRKPKVTRVTSGHEEVMIPLSWVCLRRSIEKTDFWAQYGPKIHFFDPKSIFCNVIQIFGHHHDRTPKWQGFCVETVARGASERPPGSIFGPKIFISYATPI